MKFIFKLVKPLLKRIVRKKLSTEAYKSAVVADINEIMDIPNLTEEEEEAFLSSLYDALAKALLTMVERM